MDMKKKPFYKRLKFYVFAFCTIVLVGIFAFDPPEIETSTPIVATEKSEKPAPVQPSAGEKSAEQLASDKAAAERIDEITKGKEEKAAEAAKAKVTADKEAKTVKKEANVGAIEELNEAYDRYIAEAQGIIVSIEPTEDYEIVNVMLYDAFEYASVENRQAFVEMFGSKIETGTRARIFEGRDSKDFLSVYFVNSKGEQLVKTGRFHIGWKAK